MGDQWLRMPFSEAVEVNPRRPVSRGTLAPYVDMATLPTEVPSVRPRRVRRVGGGGSRFSNGDTLFARITPCTENGKTGLVEDLAPGGVGTGSTEFIVLGPRERLTLPRFVYYLAKEARFRSFAVSRMRGTSGRQRVPAPTFDDFEVGVPPLSEQRKIAAILSSVDEVIGKTQTVIDQVQVVKRGLMQELLTKGRPGRHRRFKETAIGRLPEAWRVHRLQDLCRVVRGSTPRPARDTRFFDGDHIPWITVSEVTRDTWPFLESTRTKLTELGSRFSRELKLGTVILTNSGVTLGVPKILNIDGCANDGIAALLDTSESLDSLYLYYVLAAQTTSFRTGVARGVGQPNLNTALIGSTQIAVPSRPEQEEIAHVLLGCDRHSLVESDCLKKLRRLKESLMSVLLTGELRVTPDPEPE